MVQNRNMDAATNKSNISNNDTSSDSSINLKHYITQNALSECAGVTTQTIGRQFKELGIQTNKYGRTSLVHWKDAKKLLTARGYVYPNQVISMQMLKGGSGKTSSTFNLGIRAHQYGFRVLFIDLDMQGNLSSTLHQNSSDHPTLVDYVKGTVEFEDLILKIEDGIDLIPSHFANSSLDVEIFTRRTSFQKLLKTPIDNLRKKYDLILIDCNPSLSVVNIASAMASDTVLIPVNPDSYSMEGLNKTISEIKRISIDNTTSPDVKIFCTLFDQREATSRTYLVEYATTYQTSLMSSTIRRSADVRTGTSTNNSVFELRQSGPAQEDYDLLTREILNLKLGS